MLPTNSSIFMESEIKTNENGAEYIPKGAMDQIMEKKRYFANLSIYEISARIYICYPPDIFTNHAHNVIVNTIGNYGESTTKTNGKDEMS